MNLRFIEHVFGIKKLFLIIFLVSTFYFISSDFFIIKKIDILSENLPCVDNSNLKSKMNLYGKNILFLDLKKGEDSLKSKFLCIKKIDFSKSLPDGLKISVFQRKAEIILTSIKGKFASDSAIEKLIVMPATQSAQILEGGQDYVVDNEGVIFSKTNDENLDRVYIPLDLSLGQKIDGDLIKNLLKMLGGLKTFGINTDISVIELENLIFINSRPKIIFRINAEVDSQIAALQLIQKNAKINDKEIEFIDLRFDKPVVRYGKRQSNLRN